MTAVIFILLIILIFSNPMQSIIGASRGLSLWYTKVVPALLPSMLLSSYIIKGYPGKFLKKHPLLRILTPFIAGSLCGSPMGAKVCRDLQEEKTLSYKAAQSLLFFVQMPSPMFVFGFAFPASGIDPLTGAIFLYMPQLTAMTALIIIRRNIFFDSQALLSDNSYSEKDFFDSVCTDCLYVICRIGILLMLCCTANSLLCRYLPEKLTLFFSGIIEMTSGIDMLTHMSGISVTVQSICLFFLSFGGLCIHSQIFQIWKTDTRFKLLYTLLRFPAAVLTAAAYYLTMALLC